MILDIARIVRYCLSEADVQRIRRARTTEEGIRLRLEDMGDPPRVPLGLRVGTDPLEGEVYPMLIVRVHPADSTVNGQVFLDGSDVLWVQRVALSEVVVPGTWRWPESLLIATGGVDQ